MMNTLIKLTTLMALAFFCHAPGESCAQVTIPAADGSDGPFNPTGSTYTVDLSTAPTGLWNSLGGDVSGDGRADGVYDPNKWAIVFKYSSVNIPTGTTVKFINHRSGAPVVWLISGGVTIAGTLDLSGESATGTTFRHIRPGPGGFYGGIGSGEPAQLASGGFGPGGAGLQDRFCPASGSGSSASHGTQGQGNRPGATYGSGLLLPLIGGSGGPGYNTSQTRPDGAGGGGGGAILIASAGTITLNGSVRADGGRDSVCGGGGSGGAVRILADRLISTGGNYGVISAMGGKQHGPAGGNGRVRIEANSISGNINIAPATVAEPVEQPVAIWPPNDAPTVRLISVATVPTPDDPGGIFEPAGADVVFDSNDLVDIIVETTYMDPSSSVIARIAPAYGAPIEVSASHTGGDFFLSTWVATSTIPRGLSAIQVRAEAR